MAGRQRAEPGGKEGDAEAVRRADPDRAGNRFALAADIGARGDHVSFHPLRDSQKAFAGRREFRPCRQPAEELGFEGGFESRHAPRYGGMIEFEPLRRAEDLARSRHGQEDAHVIPIHRACNSGLWFAGIQVSDWARH